MESENAATESNPEKLTLTCSYVKARDGEAEGDVEGCMLG